jgi:hypothetical protein
MGADVGGCGVRVAELDRRVSLAVATDDGGERVHTAQAGAAFEAIAFTIARHEPARGWVMEAFLREHHAAAPCVSR